MTTKTEMKKYCKTKTKVKIKIFLKRKLKINQNENHTAEQWNDKKDFSRMAGVVEI